MSIMMVMLRAAVLMVKLYKADASPPARAAMMSCEIFGVPVEMVDVNLVEGEHQKPEFIKKNPLHRVPVRDLIIHDSHAIVAYLAEAYGNDDSWYPKDVKKRALVNQKLFFDTEILFGRLRNITYFAFIMGEKNPPKYKLDDVREAYDFLEQFLTKSKYLALDTITIADVCAFATVTSLALLIPIDGAKYPKLQVWIKDIEKQPFAMNRNEPGIKSYIEILKSFEINKN